MRPASNRRPRLNPQRRRPLRQPSRGRGATTVRVAWTDNATNEQGFRVSDNVTTQVVGQNPSQGYMYFDYPTNPSTWECFHVQAFNSAGDSAWSAWSACLWTPPATTQCVVVATGILYHDNAAWDPAGTEDKIIVLSGTFVAFGSFGGGGGRLVVGGANGTDVFTSAWLSEKYSGEIGAFTVWAGADPNAFQYSHSSGDYVSECIFTAP